MRITYSIPNVGHAVLTLLDGDLRLWELTDLYVYPKARGNGNGGLLLTQLCNDADACRRIIQLAVCPVKGKLSLTHNQLEAWYMRHGFEYDFNSEYMLRDWKQVQC